MNKLLAALVAGLFAVVTPVLAQDKAAPAKVEEAKKDVKKADAKVDAAKGDAKKADAKMDAAKADAKKEAAPKKEKKGGC